jgi:hypothetical protein
MLGMIETQISRNLVEKQGWTWDSRIEQASRADAMQFWER